MSGLARKVLICAAVDGLVIQPLSTKGQRPFQTLGIKYGDDAVSLASPDQVPDCADDESCFEAFGIIGLLTVSKNSYLVSITRRQQVAQIGRSPIYAVTEVALTPCATAAEAKGSVRKTHRHLLRSATTDQDGDDSDSSGEEDVDPRASIADDVDDAATFEADGKARSPRSRVAEDVFQKRGSYGRFARNWFGGSNGGWSMGRNRPLGVSNSPTLSPTRGQSPTEDQPPNTYAPGASSDLLPKLLRTVQVLLGSSRSFYFAYDFDITRDLRRRTASPLTDAPLYSQVDQMFFWNRNLMQPFLAAGYESVALPLMLGFVGQRSFTVDSNPPQTDDSAAESVELHNLSSPPSGITSPQVEKSQESSALQRLSEKSYTITLISRRSTRRAGLRYLRRGVNQDGFVANMVETEQLLMPRDSDDQSREYSLLQIRGSLPLFFSQSPYSLKPVPVLQHSEAVNRLACQKHFDMLKTSYGDIQIVNLVEKHGMESAIGTRYENTVAYLNRLANEENESTASGESSQSPLEFEWFDFHRACRGMKFENVSLLLSRLRDKLEGFGSTSVRDGKIVETQKGIIRTNCMDCLDRTNVCQSSFARHMLDVQLKEDGFDMSAQADQENIWFNTLWADNGDAISKQYASTAAMKGDYTRTKKRDYRGALNDMGLSLARFYSGMVNDYFSQAAIDFLLGNVNDKVFEEFEADMMTKDPAMSIAKMREQAIELCQKRVVADENEDFLGGWALLTPNVPNTVKSLPMEEVVLLLTDAALYLCRFDWNMDKVSSFERVNLSNVVGIKLGTYITSTISPAHSDPSRNVGFVVTYQPGKSDVKRTNTRTLSSRGDLAPSREEAESERPMSFVGFFGGSSPRDPPQCKLAFKAPYVDSSMAVSGSPRQTEMQQVTTICSEIERLTLECRLPMNGSEEKGEVIENGDIISLEEARRNTGLFEQLGHSIKKLVWA